MVFVKIDGHQYEAHTFVFLNVFNLLGTTNFLFAIWILIFVEAY